MFGDKIIYKTNSYRQRSPEHTFKKARDKKRIVVMGDSITFGFGVNEKYLYSHVFQNKLNMLKGKHIYEVINAAVGAYSVQQQYFYLKCRLLRLKPDVIVLAVNPSNFIKYSDWCWSDKKQTVSMKYPKRAKYASNSQGLLKGRFKYIGKYLDKLYVFRFYIKIFIEEYLFSSSTNQQMGNDDQIEKYQRYFRSQNNCLWSMRKNYLGKISALCKKNNINFLLILFPLTAQFEKKKYLNPQKAVLTYCRLNYINVIDMLSVFINYNRVTSDKIFIDEVHLSKYGHQLVAKQLIDYIH